MRVIAVCGTNGAGKNTLVDFLKEKFNCEHIKVRDLIWNTAKEKGVDLKNREDFINFTESYYSEGKSLIKDFLLENKDLDRLYIIESIRRIIEINDIRQICPDSILIGVDAPIEVRYERISKRQSITDSVTYEKFKEDEEKESDGVEITEMNLPKCVSMSDIVINNARNYEEFYKEISDKVLLHAFFTTMVYGKAI